MTNIFVQSQEKLTQDVNKILFKKISKSEHEIFIEKQNKLLKEIYNE
jgi:hypothetical protein